MKRIIAAAAAAISLIFSSCEILTPPDAPGELHLSFSDASYLQTRQDTENMPDTNSFILSVKDSHGDVIYQGAYGDSPESMSLKSGSYTVSAVSSEFKTPKFSSPQFGDRQVVVVTPGSPTFVQLVCRQMNAGVRLVISPDFLKVYPGGSLFLKNSDGKLMYGYSEKRVAYFSPGSVSLMMSDAGTDQTLLTRTLESQEILTLSISAADAGSTKDGISIQIDTVRNYVHEDFVIGGQHDKGGSSDQAMNITTAKNHIGEEGVWVYGYIVGGDLSSANASFSGPFKSKTNLVIASRSSTTDKSSCMSVQLQKGNIRDALNLVDNPDKLGTQVFLKGDIVEAYYGIPGIQNITEFEFR